MAMQVLAGGYDPDEVRRIIHSEIQEALEMVKCGVFTINEVRRNFGYPPTGWGDQMATLGGSAE